MDAAAEMDIGWVHPWIEFFGIYRGLSGFGSMTMWWLGPMNCHQNYYHFWEYLSYLLLVVTWIS